MAIDTSGIHHITIRVNDMERAKRFYAEVLGFAVEAPADDLAYFVAGDTLVVLRPPLEGTPPGDRFDERRIGVDHLAFAVSGRDELEKVVETLRAGNVSTEGIERDPVLDKDYVCFRDPDNVQWEFYSRS